MEAISERSTYPPANNCTHISNIIHKIMNELLTGTWSEAIREDKATFEVIDGRGNKWKNRTIPIDIRRNFMVPWYVIPGDSGNYRLFVVKLPTRLEPKVHFVEFLGAPSKGAINRTKFGWRRSSRAISAQTKPGAHQAPGQLSRKQPVHAK